MIFPFNIMYFNAGVNECYPFRHLFRNIILFILGFDIGSCCAVYDHSVGKVVYIRQAKKLKSVTAVIKTMKQLRSNDMLIEEWQHIVKKSADRAKDVCFFVPVDVETIVMNRKRTYEKVLAPGKDIAGLSIGYGKKSVLEFLIC